MSFSVNLAGFVIIQEKPPSSLAEPYASRQKTSSQPPAKLYSWDAALSALTEKVAN